MQAINTYFIAPTNSRGPRIKAKAQAGTVTLDWDEGLDDAENHKRGCVMLVEKYGWHYGTWIMGWLPDGSGVWVCLDDKGLSPSFKSTK